MRFLMVAKMLSLFFLSFFFEHDSEEAKGAGGGNADELPNLCGVTCLRSCIGERCSMLAATSTVMAVAHAASMTWSTMPSLCHDTLG